MLRPMRPNPLIPTLMAITFLHAPARGRPHAKQLSLMNGLHGGQTTG
jgi:hypothetical protein